jgi:hypothetical protein
VRATQDDTNLSSEGAKCDTLDPLGCVSPSY